MSRRASRPCHLLWSHLMLCLHASMPLQRLARAEPCGDSQREPRHEVSQVSWQGGHVAWEVGRRVRGAWVWLRAGA